MTKTLGIYVGSLLLLLGAVLASSRADREVAVSGFPMDRVPARLGAWRSDSVQPAPPAGQDEGALHVSRVYSDAAGARIRAELKVTSSRIGSMRDYDTVMIGRGWTPEPMAPWEVSLPGVPFQVRASRAVLKQGLARQYALNWFVSPGSQAFTLREATLAGWRQRLTGNPLWGQVYLTIASKGESAEAQQQLCDFAGELFPAFYRVLCDYGAGRFRPTKP